MKRDDGLETKDFVALCIMLVVFITSLIWSDMEERTSAAVQSASHPIIPVMKFETPTEAEPEQEVNKELVEVWQGSSEIDLPEDEQEVLYSLCIKYSVPMAYALAIIESESGFDSESIGSLGEVGYFQIHPCHWDEMSQNGIDVFTTYGNLEAGVKILNDCLVTFRDLEAATMGFKCGKYRAIDLVSQGVRLESAKEVTELAIYYEPIVKELGYIKK